MTHYDSEQTTQQNAPLNTDRRIALENLAGLSSYWESKLSQAKLHWKHSHADIEQWWNNGVSYVKA